MKPQLSAHHTRDRDGRPLVLLDGLPGEGAELYPHQLRQLARQLNTIANDADQGVRGYRTYGDAR